MLKRSIISIKKIMVILGITLFLNMNTVFADLSGDMQNMWNDTTGGMSNITDPGTFRTQNAYGVSGGSLVMRVPTKTYTVTSATMPSVKAGCGGIDIYLGSLSMMSADKIVQMLKEIMIAGAITFAFQLAMDVISPLIGSELKHFMREMMDFLNNSVNTCQMGQQLAGGARGLMQSDQGQTCEEIRRNAGDDVNSAKESCRADGDNTLDGADAETKKVKFIEGNIMWRALKDMPGIDDEEKFFLMSLTGTYVYTISGGAQSYKGFPSTLNQSQLIRSFMFGKDGSATTVTIPLLTCDLTADEDCMNPIPADRAVEPFSVKVERNMMRIASKIQERNEGSSGPIGPEDIAFVNATASVPVWKLLSVTTTYTSGAPTRAMVDKYKDYIAMEYASYYLNRALDIAKKAATGQKGGSALEDKHLEAITKNIDSLVDNIKKEYAEIVGKAKANVDVEKDVVDLERKFWSKMPLPVKNMVRDNANQLK